MTHSPSEIKRTAELRLEELRIKRKKVIDTFRKKVEEVKIQQIKDSLL